MPYPETIKYIKDQLDKGISEERTRTALEESGYQLDIIDKLMEGAGPSKIKKDISGIEKLILKDVAIGIILLVIVGSISYFTFFAGEKAGIGGIAPQPALSTSL